MAWGSLRSISEGLEEAACWCRGKTTRKEQGDQGVAPSTSAVAINEHFLGMCEARAPGKLNHVRVQWWWESGRGEACRAQTG